MRTRLNVLAGCLLSLLFAVETRPAALGATFLIFPLENLSSAPALGWLGEGLAFSIARGLRIPGVEVVDYEDRLRLTEAADLPPNAPLSRASMIRIAQHASVGRLVMGSYSGTAENLQITIRVLEMTSLKLEGRIAANGPLSALPQLENELGWNILAHSGLSGSYSREEFRARTRAIPNLALSYYVRSLELDDQEEQGRLLLKAVELHGDFPEALIRLGRRSIREGDCAKAISYLESAQKNHRADSGTEFMLGNCYLRQNALSQAIQCFSELASAAPSVESLNNLAVAYLRNGELSLAEQNLRAARNLSAIDPTVALNLSILRHLQNDDRSAQEVIEEALRLNPSHGILHLMLGLVLNSQEQGERAHAALERARGLGVAPEKLLAEDPRKLTRTFSTWRPTR